MSTKRSRMARLRSLVRRPAATPSGHSRSRQLGQVLPIFAIMSVVLLGGAALLTDVAYWWTMEQRMQRAADAGSLAGAIFLPGRPDLAEAAARAETRKNGFENGVAGMNVQAFPETDLPGGGDPRKLLVHIDGPVDTSFARVFCWDGGPCLRTVDVGVTGSASYVLPVPMGSPQNYYGVGFLRDVVTTTSQTPHTGDTTRGDAMSGISGTWTNPQGAYGSGDTYSTNVGASHIWGPFDFSGLPDPLTITAIRVRLGNAEVGGFGTPPSCRVSVRVSWDNGNTWSNPVQSGRLTTSDQTMWVPQSVSPSHTWTRAELNSSLRVELTRTGNNADCPSGRQVRVGDLDVQATYDWTQTSTSTSIEEVDVLSPDDAADGTIGDDVLEPQNFWGTVHSQGASSVNGDAFMSAYDVQKTRDNPDYDPASYYQYAVEFPPGSTNGEVWVFDPGFCQVGSNGGTGEFIFGDGIDTRPMSTYYDLYDTANTLYLTHDDTLVASFDDTFADGRLYADHDIYDGTSSNHRWWRNNAHNCADASWHNEWVRLRTGLAGGRTYRLHIYTTDEDSPNNQRDTDAHNAFAIWSQASSGTPRIYGLGAMEAYTRLPADQRAEFYLAQIDKEHAGKTMVISLWDPGDTADQSAELQILEPREDDYEPVAFSYSAEQISSRSQASDCDDESGSGVSSVVTNPGGWSNRVFNGCWLTIEIPLATDYSAPHPASDDITSEGGWWKIRYDMRGGDDPSTDLTTWKVELRGNPVHLVPN